MKYQRFNLLTTLIVSALHPNEPQSAGTKWEPSNTMDIQEANELTLAGYAEKIDASKDDRLTPTWLQRQDEAKRKAVDDAATVDDKRGEPVAETANDELLLPILEGSVDQVKAELTGLTVADLYRLDELESADGAKDRKGVHDAIADAIAELEGE